MIKRYRNISFPYTLYIFQTKEFNKVKHLAAYIHQYKFFYINKQDETSIIFSIWCTMYIVYGNVYTKWPIFVCTSEHCHRCGRKFSINIITKINTPYVFTHQQLVKSKSTDSLHQGRHHSLKNEEKNLC
jgi:hypothetical protein